MSLIICLGYCEHGKFMGECWDCVADEVEDDVLMAEVVEVSDDR